MARASEHDSGAKGEISDTEEALLKWKQAIRDQVEEVSFPSEVKSPALHGDAIK